MSSANSANFVKKPKNASRAPPLVRLTMACAAASKPSPIVGSTPTRSGPISAKIATTFLSDSTNFAVGSPPSALALLSVNSKKALPISAISPPTSETRGTIPIKNFSSLACPSSLPVNSFHLPVTFLSILRSISPPDPGPAAAFPIFPIVANKSPKTPARTLATPAESVKVFESFPDSLSAFTVSFQPPVSVSIQAANSSARGAAASIRSIKISTKFAVAPPKLLISTSLLFQMFSICPIFPLSVRTFVSLVATLPISVAVSGISAFSLGNHTSASLLTSFVKVPKSASWVASLTSLNSSFMLISSRTKPWALGESFAIASANLSTPPLAPPVSLFKSFKASLASKSDSFASAMRALFSSTVAVKLFVASAWPCIASVTAIAACSTPSWALARAFLASVSFSIADTTRSEPSTPFLTESSTSFWVSSVLSFALRSFKSASAKASSASRRARLLGGRFCTLARASLASSKLSTARCSDRTASSKANPSCWIASIASSRAFVVSSWALRIFFSASTTLSAAFVWLFILSWYALSASSCCLRADSVALSFCFWTVRTLFLALSILFSAASICLLIFWAAPPEVWLAAPSASPIPLNATFRTPPAWAKDENTLRRAKSDGPAAAACEPNANRPPASPVAIEIRPANTGPSMYPVLISRSNLILAWSASLLSEENIPPPPPPPPLPIDFLNPLEKDLPASSPAFPPSRSAPSNPRLMSSFTWLVMARTTMYASPTTATRHHLLTEWSIYVSTKR